MNTLPNAEKNDHSFHMDDSRFNAIWVSLSVFKKWMFETHFQDIDNNVKSTHFVFSISTPNPAFTVVNRSNMYDWGITINFSWFGLAINNYIIICDVSSPPIRSFYWSLSSQSIKKSIVLEKLGEKLFWDFLVVFFIFW